MILGVGSFARTASAPPWLPPGPTFSTYLTRDYGHYPPSLVGETFFCASHIPARVPLVRERKIDSRHPPVH